MAHRHLAASATAAALLIVILPGCARSQGDYADDISELCAQVNEQFAGKLALGEKSFRPEDFRKFVTRIQVLEDFRRQADAVELPKDGAKPEPWRTELDKFIDSAMSLKSDYKNARPGSDLVLALGIAAHDGYAERVGTTAGASGLGACADTSTWHIFKK